MEVSSAILERAAQSLRLLPNVALLSERRPYGLSRPCAGLRLQLPVYPHLLLRRSPIATVATGLGVMIWGGGGGGRGEGKYEVDDDDLRVSWIKVRESCARSSASLSRPGPSRSSGKTRSTQHTIT